MHVKIRIKVEKSRLKRRAETEFFMNRGFFAYPYRGAKPTV